MYEYNKSLLKTSKYSFPWGQIGHKYVLAMVYLCEDITNNVEATFDTDSIKKFVINGIYLDANILLKELLMTERRSANDESTYKFLRCIIILRCKSMLSFMEDKKRWKDICDASDMETMEVSDYYKNLPELCMLTNTCCTRMADIFRQELDPNGGEEWIIF